MEPGDGTLALQRDQARGRAVGPSGELPRVPHGGRLSRPGDRPARPAADLDAALAGDGEDLGVLLPRGGIPVIDARVAALGHLRCSNVPSQASATCSPDPI